MAYALPVRVTRAGADFSRSFPTVVKVQVVWPPRTCSRTVT